MADDPGISNRKHDHIKGALQWEKLEGGSCFSRYTVRHNALPEINLDNVNTSSKFLGRKIAAPFMIGSLTGGPDLASTVNRNLAAAAQERGIPLCLGSAKIAIKDKSTTSSFDVRELCPEVPLLVNLGLVDLGVEFTLDDCRELVKRLEADALIFHLNPLHEAMQAEGNTAFAGLQEKLRRVAGELGFPVIVKEVGHGISPEVFARLDACGVHSIDIAGAGGTSWGYIEGARAKDPARACACGAFANWGLPADWILEQMRGRRRSAKLIASGGVRGGADVFKCLCLGADYAAAALPFLRPAMDSAEAVSETLERFLLELRLAMFSAGCRDTASVSREMLIP